MWSLIIFALIPGSIFYKQSPTMAGITVPGFESQEQCKAAGNTVADNLLNFRASVAITCAYTGEK